MKLIVLLKQVPSTESFVSVGDDKKSVKTEDVKWVINPYDEFAVEEALKIKEALGGTVTIVTVGNDKAVEAIRTALAMGADNGILINDPAAYNCDGAGISKILAATLKKMEYDLIIAGQRAVDDDNYYVGAATAELLNIPHISMVIKEEITDNKIKCVKTIEGGSFTFEAQLPALITTQRGLNEPRYASLPGIMKAKKKPLDTKTLTDIGISPSDLGEPMLTIKEVKKPPQRKAGVMIQGETPSEKAAALVKALHEDAKAI